jgi:hypothetical protein
MELTAEQLRLAAKIDAEVQALVRGGRDDLAIFVGMADLMPGFKRVMDISDRGAMDELSKRYVGFYRYAKILEGLAGDIQSGTIKVPK